MYGTAKTTVLKIIVIFAEFATYNIMVPYKNKTMANNWQIGVVIAKLACYNVIVS